MIVWRVSSKRMVSSALSGEGAFRFPGRWNHFGTPVVYVASSAELALLEYMAHVPRQVVRPVQLVLLEIALPEHASMRSVRQEALPADWQSIPPGSSTRDIGTAWAQSRESLGLNVPSVLLPNGIGRIGLLNPLHPQMAGVTILKQHPFDLDERLPSARQGGA